MSVPCSLVIACCERADLLALLCVMFPCIFVICVLRNMVNRLSSEFLWYIINNNLILSVCHFVAMF